MVVPVEKSIATYEIDRKFIELFPADFVQEKIVIPLKADPHKILVGAAAPPEQATIEDIKLLTGREVHIAIYDESEILDKISESYEVTVESMIEGLSPEDQAAIDDGNLHSIEVMANEPTVVNLVNLILSSAIQERASDIHLVPYEEKLDLRYRIDGILQEQSPPPRKLHAAVISRLKIMADMNIAERFVPQDGHIQIQHKGSRIDIRVGTMPTVHGESMVLRLLEKSSNISSPADMGLGKERGEILEQLIAKPHGIYLTTGPTGSGKTTTLYSLLQSIYDPGKKIITIEDPVEYEMNGVAQIPVRPSRGLSFAAGLRAILRQDPDIVMVGEIRDSETAEIAIRAALTGHQVFSTLHTNDSAGAITRLVDMGIEPFLISSALEVVLAQRLVRKLCGNCIHEKSPEESQILQFKQAGLDVSQDSYFSSKGCDECHNIGYKGRVGVFELLPINSDLREMIIQKKSSGEIKEAAKRGMLSIRQDALEKARNGITSLEEVIRVTAGDHEE